MAHLTIHVPDEHVDRLRAELLRTHERVAAELRRAVDAHVGSHDGIDAIEGAVVELRDVAHAIEQLGWEPSPAAGPWTVRAHPELLTDVLSRMLEAVMAELLRGSECGGPDLDDAQRGTAAGTLVELLRTVEGSGS